MADQPKKPAAKKRAAKKPAAKKRAAKKPAAKKRKDRSQVDLLPELFEAPAAIGAMSQPSPAVESNESAHVLVTTDQKKNTSEDGFFVQPKAKKSTTEAVESQTESARAAEEVSTTSPRPQDHQLVRARDLVQSGRIEEALKQYLEILAENPLNLRAHNNLGVLFDELGQHDTAVEHLESALQVDKDNVEVLTNLGGALTKLGRFGLAGKPIRKALRLAPDDPGARLAQAILSFRRGLYSQAEAELRWICDRDSEAGDAFYYRAEALNRTGRFSEATTLMCRAAELLPDDARPYYTLGHLYDRQNRPFEAAEMYRRARDLQRT